MVSWGYGILRIPAVSCGMPGIPRIHPRVSSWEIPLPYPQDTVTVSQDAAGILSIPPHIPEDPNLRFQMILSQAGLHKAPPGPGDRR